ncbi:MAG: hypothetical protein GY810_03645 [Aureispira sp.]|nr:hypothetical protein [Aureispira sp.]
MGKTDWEVQRGHTVYFASIQNRKLILGENQGGNPHTEVASVYDLRKFINGLQHPFIQDKFGEEALAEMQETAKEILGMI